MDQPREGSAWRRWDLHIHAPTALLNNQFEGASEEEKWERYLVALEAAGAYGALGITDYMSIDGYEKAVRYKESGRLTNVLALLPNVEFRIVPVTGDARAINLHLILAPDIVDRLDELLWTNLEFRYAGNAYKCTRNDLIRLGRAHAREPELEERTAYRRGVEQFKIEFGQIEECLQKNRDLREHALVAVANSSNDGNSGIQDSGLAALRTEIYRLADIILSGNPKDRRFFLGQSESASAEEIQDRFGSLKPCIHGCDAHELGRIGKPDLDRHSWIKADPTFEGLRQILFEPESRVQIGPVPPPTPVHRARSAQISVPAETQIIWDGDPHEFCLRGDTNLAFAAGLTCVIGGRGAGKSTLLNMVEERLSPGKNEFWRGRQLRNSGRTLSMTECINLDLTGDQTQVEFVAQNQVEQFALDPARLTAAILSRLLSMDSAGRLRAAKARVEEAVGDAKRKESLIKERQVIRERVADRRQRREALETLAKSFTDPQYVAASVALQAAAASQQRLASSRERLREALSGLRETARKHRSTEHAENQYDVQLAGLLSTVDTAIAEAEQGRDLRLPGEEEVRLAAVAAEHRRALEEFLASRGLSPENLRDVSDASAKAGEAGIEEKEAEAELVELEGRLEHVVLDTTVRSEFDTVTGECVSDVNRRFSGDHAEARRLELTHGYDTDAAEEDAIRWLSGELTARFGSTTVRSDHLRSTLEKAGPILETDSQILVDTLRKDEGSKTAQTLDAFFSVAPNVELWDNHRARLVCDRVRFLKVDVLYDGRPLTLASFGQRCSAVLVVLISLGNSPIVIDEPEAHLDSSIIANFMVEMVKRVKRHRQIIFATHNANFVVNGDAELIHILAMDDHKRTTVRSATLEDLELRPLILSLEGGERAFRQREGRYRLPE